jgi:uncharacterized membrane protein
MQAKSMADSKPPRSGNRWHSFPRLYVAMCLVCGLAMMIITPPFQVPDEPHHFMRAYQISEGHFLPTFRDRKGGAELPISFVFIERPFDMTIRHGLPIDYQDIKLAMQIPLAPEQRMYFTFSNTSAYPPLPYFAESIAIALGRLVLTNALPLMYLARFANLLVWCAAGYVTLSLAPGLSRPLFLIMLMPMSMYQAASMSGDVLTNSLVFIFSALVWNQAMAFRDGYRVPKPLVAVLFVLACGIGLTKFIYLPLTGLVMLIPAAAFGGRLRWWLIVCSILLAGAASQALWARQTPGLDMVANGVRTDFLPRAQIAYLRAHPADWPKIVINTFRYSYYMLWGSFVGTFGWMVVAMSFFAYLSYHIALLWSCAPLKDEPVLAPLWKWIVVPAAVITASFFILMLTAYLYWNVTGWGSVDGLQGRYLIPMAPAGVMLITALWRRLPPAFRLKTRPARLRLICALIVTAMMAYALLTIYRYFYIVGAPT